MFSPHICRDRCTKSSDNGNQGSSYTEEQPPFASEQVSWIDQLVAGRLSPQCRAMHCASEVAGGTLGTSASVSLVTMALSQVSHGHWRREPCCYHVVLRPSFRRGIIGGTMWQTLFASCSPYPCTVATMLPSLTSIAFIYASNPRRHCWLWFCDHYIYCGFRFGIGTNISCAIILYG